ncbi:hypothetical protein HYALB_00006016 [Hymenoscyphus albidus]|uniref:Distal membrane-arm assembly complex protein 1-like domain-containing protein n=1 Tax=Hymenoscyphus albidus TaxID=595503 RepID=A0A9N9LJC6_9HELO|nr:hypothetical protein HYALB_00006016 [Hymenoscyphus albidus]
MANNPPADIEPLATALARDRDDCMPCRIVGASAFIGLGAYSWYSGHTQLERQQAKILASKSMFGMKSRQAGITTIALSLVGLGLFRLAN